MIDQTASITPEELEKETMEPFTQKVKSPWFNFERNEIFLLLSYFMFGIAFSNYEPYAPVWLGQFFAQESYLIIGFVIIIPSLISAFGSPFWGVLADRYGSKKFVLLGLTAYTLMFFSLIFTYSSTYFLVMILFGCLIGSASVGNLFVLATKSIVKPKEIILAKLTISVSISYAMMSPLAGWLYDTFSSSMIIQLIIAIIFSLLAIFFATFIKEPKGGNIGNRKVEVNGMKAPSKLTLFPFVFIGLLFFTFFFQSGAGFWAYSSIYFLNTMKIKGVFFSLYLIAKMLLAIPLSFLLGRVKRERSMGLIIMCFTAYYVVVYSIMSIFPTSWVLFIILNSLPMYPIYNVFLFALVATYSNERKRGIAFGILNVISTLGYSTGIIILGTIADNTSYEFLTKLWPTIIAAIATHERLEVLFMFIPSVALSTVTFFSAFFLFIFQFRKTKQREDNSFKESEKTAVVKSGLG